MQRTLTIGIVVLGVLLSWPSPAWPDTSVWKVEKGDRTIYLGGTIHMLKPEDFPLPEEFEQAFAASQQVVFETDIGAIATPAVQTRLMELSRAPEEQTLDKVLSPDTYQQLAEALAKRGMSIDRMRSYRAGVTIVTLQTVELMRLGMALEGVDSRYYQAARQQGKHLEFLETVEEQLGYIASMGQGWEERFVKLSLRELSRTASLIEAISQAWREGDTDALDSLFVKAMQKDYPRAYRKLLRDRNRRWLGEIETLFKQPETAFVLVGVAHMVGRDGLLHQLKKRGYKVSHL